MNFLKTAKFLTINFFIALFCARAYGADRIAAIIDRVDWNLRDDYNRIESDVSIAVYHEKDMSKYIMNETSVKKAKEALNNFKDDVAAVPSNPRQRDIATWSASKVSDELSKLNYDLNKAQRNYDVTIQGYISAINRDINDAETKKKAFFEKTAWFRPTNCEGLVNKSVNTEYEAFWGRITYWEGKVNEETAKLSKCRETIASAQVTSEIDGRTDSEKLSDLQRNAVNQENNQFLRDVKEDRRRKEEEQKKLDEYDAAVRKSKELYQKDLDDSTSRLEKEKAKAAEIEGESSHQPSALEKALGQ